MVQIFFILICLLSYQIGKTQTDYVVTTQGDTIKGKVKYLNTGLEKKVQITPNDGKKIIYSVTQTFAFKLEGDIYCPVRYTQGYTYMKLLKAGYLSLYSFQLPNQITWDGRYLVKKDGKGIEVPNIGFKKILSQFLSECPEVTKRIASGEISKNKMNDIIDQYNNCISSNTEKQTSVQTSKPLVNTDAWNTLEANVTALVDFAQKVDALEMIAEIKSKVKRSERIPNFLTEGLKEALKDQPSMKETLDKALAEIKN